jgi:small multidrug resistance pump
MMKYNKIFIYIILICIAEAVAVSCVKKYDSIPGDMNGLPFFAFAIFCYACVCYFLRCSFQLHSKMGTTVVLWSAISILLVTLSGILFFGEKLEIRQIVAGLLVISAVYILHC